MRRASFIAAFAVLAAISASVDAGIPRYRLIILPDDPSSFRTRAMAINELGQVAGDIALPQGISNAVFWASGDQVHEVIHGPGEDLAFANDLNDAGVVVGSAGEGQFAFAWTSGTVYEPLPATVCCADPRAINEDGTIVGKGNHQNGSTFTAVWQDGELLDFGALPGHCCSDGMDINDLGAIVGSSEAVAALWEGGGVVEIGGLGGLFATANGVNNRGEAAGVAQVASTTRPFYWNGGRIVELPLLGENSGQAESINDSGVIVGQSAAPLTSEGPWVRATTWIDGEAHDLNELVVDRPVGVYLIIATDINNASQIVGSVDIDGTLEAFRLDPVAPADLNADGSVNAADLALLLGAWGTCNAEGGCIADLTGDGHVNATDLALLLGAWG